VPFVFEFASHSCFQISLRDDLDIMTGAQLLERLGDCLLRLRPKSLSETESMTYEQNFSDAIAQMSRLMTGIDVNVKFDQYVATLHNNVFMCSLCLGVRQWNTLQIY
jgi:hypothetical protein